MESEVDRTITALFSGWFEILSLFLFLAVALLLLGWAFNRNARPKDRGSNLPWQLLLPAFACALMLNYFDGPIVASIIITAGVLAASLIAGGSERGPFYICGILFAGLLGMGLTLSALLFLFIATIAILVSPGKK